MSQRLLRGRTPWLDRGPANVRNRRMGAVDPPFRRQTGVAPIEPAGNGRSTIYTGPSPSIQLASRRLRAGADRDRPHMPRRRPSEWDREPGLFGGELPFPSRFGSSARRPAARCAPSSTTSSTAKPRKGGSPTARSNPPPNIRGHTGATTTRD